VLFIAGLMIDRTPEYLGKKIETREMKLGNRDPDHALAGAAGHRTGRDDGLAPPSG
jgi:hypothetical protein